jgi:isocitrate lyase
LPQLYVGRCRSLAGNHARRIDLARAGAEKLWQALNFEPYVNALGALTGNQAVQMPRRG